MEPGKGAWKGGLAGGQAGWRWGAPWGHADEGSKKVGVWGNGWMAAPESELGEVQARRFVRMAQRGSVGAIAWVSMGMLPAVTMTSHACAWGAQGARMGDEPEKEMASSLPRAENVCARA